MTRQRQIILLASVAALGALTWAAARAQDAPR
ncbi:MAG: hypothetical protein JWR89_5013, partial [Tardiphaga sp.]|nr:hypothetical protein [Tardiphaga sp.]